MLQLLRSFGLLSVLGAIGISSAAGGPPKEYFQLYQAASLAERAGDWEGALATWQRMQPLAPESPDAYYAAARCAARLGRRDSAFAWLEKAVAAQYQWPEQAKNNEDLSSLHGDPRWDDVINRMQATWNEDVTFWQARRPDVDPGAAPQFKSWKKLARVFDPRMETLENSRWRMAPLSYAHAILDLTDERLAADRRYLQDHPQARDLEDASWDIVATLERVRKPQYSVWNPLGPSGNQIVEAADAYLGAFPAGGHRAQVLMARAFAVFGSEPETKYRAWSADDMAALRASLSEVAKKFQGTTAGGLALAWGLVLADLECVGAVTPEMRAMREELESGYAHDRKVQDFLALDGHAVILRMEGVQQFEGTDLAGTKWDAAAFQGKVTLIDFWATWCGPCVGEIPNLKKAWSEFHDKGFQIVGVSLDADDRKSFEAWLQTNGVTWPQIWDGKGWTTPLARKFAVRSIPTPILIDANGRVDNAGLRGDELIARIRELLPED